MSERVFHLDAGKPRFDLLQWRALRDVAAVAEYGCRKYGDRNWEECADRWAWGQLLGSTFRHLSAWALREDLDAESGLPHLAHAAWNALTILELSIAGRGKDDRTNLHRGGE